ncbi:UNKNOWN [Stylonychia lemnae]|nr:UNKNOWN [Stylonychia lemnae]|eukprot:CDW85353.1 UNKNOWN [Stylonychia lemnae]
MFAQRVLFIMLSCYLTFLNSQQEASLNQASASQDKLNSKNGEDNGLLSQQIRTLQQEDSLCREQAGIQEGGIYYEVNSIKAKNGYKEFKIATVRPQKNMPHTDIISYVIFETNSWEDHNSIQIVNALKKISIQYPDYKIALLDIGANLGWFTFMAASLDYNVIAFEPLDQNYKAIEYAMCLNQNVSNLIQLEKFALGAKNETCNLYSQPQNTQNGIIRCGDDINDHSKVVDVSNVILRQEVPIRTLDSYTKTISPDIKIGVLKIDVEEFEYDVFVGGKNFLKEHKIPYIVQEYSLKSYGAHQEDHFNLFKDLGYEARLTSFNGQGFKTFNELKEEIRSQVGDNQIEVYFVLSTFESQCVGSNPNDTCNSYQ